MSWVRQNRALASFLLAFGVGTAIGLTLLCLSMSRFDDAEMEFDTKANELAELQRHNPFPSDANLRKMKAQAEEYTAALGALREELQQKVLPAPAGMQPSEFQARLQTAVKNVTDKARAHNVQLPENFFLGFEEYGTRLPETDAVPVLAQQVAQAELLATLLIEARVEAITLFRLASSASAPAFSPSPAPKPNTKAKAKPPIERSTVELAFSGSPAALRRALNQVSTADRQLYVVRTLQVLNEKETGPPREETAPTAPAAASPAAGANTAAALQFIVGNERVQAAARVEMLRFDPAS